MKELCIYDFDGVLFMDSWEIHKNLLEKYQKEFPFLRMVILEKGYIPDHIYETTNGRKYIELFSRTYFDQKMEKEIIDFFFCRFVKNNTHGCNYSPRHYTRLHC